MFVWRSFYAVSGFCEGMCRDTSVGVFAQFGGSSRATLNGAETSTLGFNTTSADEATVTHDANAKESMAAKTGFALDRQQQLPRLPLALGRTQGQSLPHFRLTLRLPVQHPLLRRSPPQLRLHDRERSAEPLLHNKFCHFVVSFWVKFFWWRWVELQRGRVRYFFGCCSLDVVWQPPVFVPSCTAIPF